MAGGEYESDGEETFAESKNGDDDDDDGDFNGAGGDINNDFEEFDPLDMLDDINFFS